MKDRLVYCPTCGRVFYGAEWCNDCEDVPTSTLLKPVPKETHAAESTDPVTTADHDPDQDQ